MTVLVFLFSDVARVEMRNVVFRGNMADSGGAIKFSMAEGIIENCTFDNNKASQTGGAIDVHWGVVSVTNSRFARNTAHQ